MAITLGGGGSASQIDEVVTLNNYADTVTLSDGRVYLKGGVYETNLSTYPLAATVMRKTGINFYVGAQESSSRAIGWDGTHYWVAGSTNDTAYKYTAAGVYTGTSFSVAAQTTVPYGIVWDGTFFWVLSNANVVYKYNSAGVYQSVSWTAAGMSNAGDIEWDGTHFYLTDFTEDKVFKFNSAGVAVANYDVSAQALTPFGITWDGTYFWVQDGTEDTIFKYNTSFVYQGESFDVLADDTNGTALTYNGTHVAMVGYQKDRVNEYGLAKGAPSNDTVLAGGQNYVRVA